MALSQRDILATLDSIECDIHSQYKCIEALRHALKEQWRVQNAPGYWPEDAKQESRDPMAGPYPPAAGI